MTRKGICEVLGRYFDHDAVGDEVDVFTDKSLFVMVSDSTTGLMLGTDPHMETFANAGLRLPIYRDGADLVLRFDEAGRAKIDHVVATFEEDDEEEERYVEDDGGYDDFRARVEEGLAEWMRL